MNENTNTQPAVSAEPVCSTCGGHGMIGGPSFYAPDEGGVPCPDCAVSEIGIPTSEPVAWVEVIDRHEGPYNFNGMALLDSGKHLLYTEHQPDRAAELEKELRIRTIELTAAHEATKCLGADADRLRGERDRLTAEVERLHAEIDRIRSKVFSATICHPRGVQPLLEEALSGAATSPMTAAARDVLAERARQIKAGYSDIDDQQINDELAAMACFYAMPPGARDWPAEETGYGATFGVAIVPDGWFPETGNRRRELVKAGAMVLAEIERLDRASASDRLLNCCDTPAYCSSVRRCTREDGKEAQS
ncbi:hypothetical protein [Niveibacterium terrae]|uniref:hypothetical protein n=1 Tax=Niveibacterium terrae TaxID=3373598 RepID=UPI003A924F09